MSVCSTGETTTLTESHEGELWGLATHPTGDLFVTACNDSTVRVWDAAQHRQRACVEVRTVFCSFVCVRVYM